MPLFGLFIIFFGVAGLCVAIWAAWHMHKDAKHEERMFQFRMWRRSMEYTGPDTIVKRRPRYRDKQL